MLRVTDDILELRTWAEERRGRPCRLPDGRLTLCFDAGEGPALPVGWGEFEVIFVGGHLAFVYDDAPGCNHCLVGSAEEARAYVRRADPRLTGAAPMRPGKG
jgi:hypothetical protein